MADYILDDNYGAIKSMLMDYDYVMYQWAENGWQNIGMKDTFVKNPTAFRDVRFGRKRLKFTWQPGKLLAHRRSKCLFPKFFNL